ncbi:MAG TPA: PH domain-containing protein [Thermoanaerobaculia bacterium]|nr:PH domain-containing protein [Thermoanaerobaculia bacterium]
MVFRSKVDGWLIWFVRVSMLGAAALLVVIAVVSQDEKRLVALAAAVVFALYLLVEWLLRSTYYTVDQDFLRIRSGPFRSRVLISDIQSIAKANGSIGTPALSRDPLAIRFKGRQILVSPRDSDLFVETLRSVNGKIELV